MTDRPGTGESVINITSIVMVLLLAGITTLFLGLTAAYLYTRITTGVHAPFPPATFFINIVVLFAGNRLLRLAYRSLDTVIYQRLKILVSGALALTVVFGFLQVVGWLEYFGDGLSIHASTAYSYLFVLSGLHLFHVVIGLPFLVHYLIRLRANSLAVARERRMRRTLRAIALYWDFLDVLWVLLVVMLVVSSAIA